jgi:hypothetical protein
VPPHQDLEGAQVLACGTLQQLCIVQLLQMGDRVYTGHEQPLHSRRRVQHWMQDAAPAFPFQGGGAAGDEGRLGVTPRGSRS